MVSFPASFPPTQDKGAAIMVGQPSSEIGWDITEPSIRQYMYLSPCIHIYTWYIYIYVTIPPWDFWWWAHMAISMHHFSWSWRVRKRMFQWLRTCRAMPSICSNQPGALLFRALKTSPSWLLSKIFESKSFHHICYVFFLCCAAPDIWSRWFWPSAAFGQRWIPWENIDSFVSSFSGRQPKQTETNRKWIGNLKGSNGCLIFLHILLVILFLIISCYFEGLYGFWGVWTDELDPWCICGSFETDPFSFEVKSFTQSPSAIIQLERNHFTKVLG